MKRFESNTQVGNGYYFNTTSWSLHAVDARGGALPGAPGTRWVKLNSLLMIMAAAVVSFAFVIFLPVIGIALFAMVVATGLAKAVARATASLVHALAPQWQPGEAWFARRNAKAAEPQAPNAPETEALRKEVAERRAGEEPPPET